MLFLLLSMLCCLLLWKVLYRTSSSDPPEFPDKLPIIGHVHKMLGDNVALWRQLDILFKGCNDLGGIVTIYLGPWPLYVVTDPEDFVTITNNCLEKDRLYNVMKPLLGEGLITGSVKTWKKHRKLINPAFHQQVLNSFIETFNSQSRRLVDQLASEVGKEIDQEHFLRLNNLETICLTSAGANFDDFERYQKEYLACTKILQAYATERVKNVFLHNDFIFSLSRYKKIQDDNVKIVKELSTRIIQNKKIEYSSGKSQSGKYKPFMDMMMELSNETGCFTDEEIREEYDNIIAGGHDTIAPTLTFVYALLGTYPKVQQKVYDEVMSVIGEYKTDIDREDLTKLVYTEAVLKETLRLYPVIPFIIRHIDKDVKLKNYTIKANSRCILSVSGLNRNPAWGPDADRFRPERWLDPDTLPNHNNFGSFSLGRRNCIGRAYAMMTMKISLAHLIRRYRIKGDISHMVLKIDLILKPGSGHHVTFELRE